MLLYTARASLPLLILILLLASQDYDTFYIITFPKNVLSRSVASVVTLSGILAFLVKFPMFSVHLWLPKAHVEAPVEGSIILAALLLKLGGYGMIVFNPLYNAPGLLRLIQAFSLIGGLRAAVLCLRQKDIKVIIAYSSVCHMALVISSLATGTV